MESPGPEARPETPDPWATPWRGPDAPAERAPTPTPAHQAPSPYQEPSPSPSPYQAPIGYGPQPGYPQQPYPQQPYQGPPPRTPSGLPKASMITGALSLVVGNIISLGVLGVIGGIVGIVLGAMGVRRTRGAPTGGRGLAVGGIVVSVVSVLVGAALLTASVPGFIQGFNGGMVEVLREAEAEAERDPAAEPEPAMEPDPAAVNPAADWDPSAEHAPAEWMNPDGPWLGIPSGWLKPGQLVSINDYTVSVQSIDLDANAEILAAHPRNSAPFGQYVLVTVYVRNQSVTARDPLDDLMVSYPGADDYLYDETSCGAVTGRPVTSVGVLAHNETAEYDVCLDVPRFALGEPRVLVHDLTTPYGDAEMWSAE